MIWLMPPCERLWPPKQIALKEPVIGCDYALCLLCGNKSCHLSQVIPISSQSVLRIAFVFGQILEEGLDVLLHHGYCNITRFALPVYDAVVRMNLL
jgi:hypothetical protein